MPRNSGGEYVNPVSPAVPGATLLAAKENEYRDDVTVALTDSLSRTGKGGMQGPLLLADGTAGVPALTFLAEPDLGFSRLVDDRLTLVNGASEIQTWAQDFISGSRPFLLTVPALSNATAFTATGNGTGLGANIMGGSGAGGNTAGGRGALITGGTGSGNGAGGLALQLQGGGPGLGGATGGRALEATAGGTNADAIRAVGTGTGVGIRSTGGIIGSNAPLTSSGTVWPLRYGSYSDDIPSGFSAGLSFGLNTLGRTNAGGGYAIGLTGGSRTRTTGDSFTSVVLGLSYDVDNVEGAGGTLYTGAQGWRMGGALAVSASTAATGTTPVAALTLTNGHLKVSGVPPNASVAIADSLTTKNIPKAVGAISGTGSGATTFTVDAASFNIVSAVAVTTTLMRITFAQSFSGPFWVWIQTQFSETVTAPNWVAFNPVTSSGVSTIDVNAKRPAFAAGSYTHEPFVLTTSPFNIVITAYGLQS